METLLNNVAALVKTQRWKITFKKGESHIPREKMKIYIYN